MHAEKYWLTANFMELRCQTTVENMDRVQPVINFEINNITNV